LTPPTLLEIEIYQQREWGDDMLVVALPRGESDYEGCLGLLLVSVAALAPSAIFGLM
jgi:hypothetical protein